MSKTPSKLTSSQRLDALETSLSMLDQAIGNIVEELKRMNQNVVLVARRAEAIVRAADAGPLSSATVAAQALQMNIQDLKDKVQNLKSQGVALDSDKVKENSFVVGRELDLNTKEVVNDRIQFAVFGMDESSRSSLLDKVVGDIVSVQAEKNLLEIIEIYDIVAAQAPTQAPAQEEGTA